MDSLRWVLVIVGIFLVVGIYFWDSWRRREHEYRLGEMGLGDDEFTDGLDKESTADAYEYLQRDLDGLSELKGERGDDDRFDLEGLPLIVPNSEDGSADDELNRAGLKTDEKESKVNSGKSRPDASGDDLIIVLNVMAVEKQKFSGSDVRAALEEVDMVHGEMDIFHHFGVGEMNADVPVFSVASMLEPGCFDLKNMDESQLPGLCLFLRLPGPLDGKVVFELMLNTGHRLAEILGGELRDETRGAITQQTVAHLRDRISEFSRRRLLRQGR